MPPVSQRRRGNALAAETEAERHRVDAQITAKLQEADARIAATKSKAVTAISDIAADTARAVVAKLIGQDVSPDEVKKVLRPASGRVRIEHVRSQ